MGSRLSHLSGPATDRLWRPQACLDIEYSGSSIGVIWRASTKWTKSPAMAPPNCSTTARSRSNLPTIMAMRPSSKASGRAVCERSSTASSNGSDRARSCLAGAAHYDRGPTLARCSPGMPANAHAFAGEDNVGICFVVIPDRKRSYIAADIPGSRSWSAGSWKGTPARRSPSRPPEWP